MASRGNTFYDAYLDLVGKVMMHGHLSSPRGMAITELMHTQLLVTDLRNNILVHPDRDLNYRFMVAEWLWIEAGQNDVASVSKYNKQIAQFSDDGEIFNGAYGPRMAGQWDWITGLLERDKDTRQAVVSIWTPAPPNSKDIPCTLSLQVLLRGGRLHGIVTMRSQDLWLGLPYDFFNFSQIVNGLAGQIGAVPGSLCFNVGSSHIYERDYGNIREMALHKSTGFTLRSPALPCRPPAAQLLKEGFLHSDFPEPFATYRDVLHEAHGKQEAKLMLAELMLNEGHLQTT